MTDTMRETIPSEATEAAGALLERALFEAKRVVVGQDQMIERVFVSWLARGHCLLEGAPGLAKTLAAKSVARILGGSFARLQFTPDLMPSDLVGTRIYRPSREEFDIELGPVFANVVLVDEINRAPAKLQSALLEVMGERQISIAGTTYAVPDPFLVLATQNPLESEGVYPLPEAQRDRFLLKVLVGHPTRAEETEIVHRMTVDPPSAGPVLSPHQVRELQHLAEQVFVHEAILDYVVRIVFATREPAREGLDDLAPLIAHGASPRATLALVSTSRALALMRGRAYVLPQDVYDVAPEVLRHRVFLSYQALAEGTDVETVVHRVMRTVYAPRVAPGQDDVHAAVAAAGAIAS